MADYAAAPAALIEPKTRAATGVRRANLALASGCTIGFGVVYVLAL
jgi:hypothetical protein